MSSLPAVIQVIGDSGSGKTLVVERATRRLVARGLAVAVVKHSHHSPDLRGKDTGRFRRAGASIVLFAGPSSFLSFLGDPAPLVPLLPVDVVLVEGYSRRRFGGLRLRVRAPAEVEGSVARVLTEVERHPRTSRRAIEVDGRRERADALWTFVHHLMERRGVRTVRRLP